MGAWPTALSAPASRAGRWHAHSLRGCALGFVSVLTVRAAPGPDDQVRDAWMLKCRENRGTKTSEGPMYPNESKKSTKASGGSTPGPPGTRDVYFPARCSSCRPRENRGLGVKQKQQENLGLDKETRAEPPAVFAPGLPGSIRGSGPRAGQRRQWARTGVLDPALLQTSAQDNDLKGNQGGHTLICEQS